MSPYGSPWPFLFSILLSGKFLGTEVELCLQRALKESYKTLVLVISVGQHRETKLRKGQTCKRVRSEDKEDEQKGRCQLVLFPHLFLQLGPYRPRAIVRRS